SQRDGRGARRAAHRGRVPRPRQAPRSVVRSGLRQLRRRRLGGAPRTHPGERKRPAHYVCRCVSVAGRRRRADHRPQLDRVRISAARSSAHPNRDPGADHGRGYRPGVRRPHHRRVDDRRQRGSRRAGSRALDRRTRPAFARPPRAGGRTVSRSRSGDGSRDRGTVRRGGPRAPGPRATSIAGARTDRRRRARIVALNVMRLDVLIATYNRAALLTRALESLAAADRPSGWGITGVVIDNRSTDDTRAVVESFVTRFDGRLQYIYESRAGRSHALNAGIAATSGDLVGMIDDDEEVDRRWFLTIANAFADSTVDFIGGPYVPRWGGERPAWLGTAYKAAVGWVDSGPGIRQYGPGFDGMLMGGNAIIRRSVLHCAGPYAADLGRSSDGRLMSCG